jgi:hypothetical protein
MMLKFRMCAVSMVLSWAVFAPDGDTTGRDWLAAILWRG